jgi:hypothetical protein
MLTALLPQPDTTIMVAATMAVTVAVVRQRVKPRTDALDIRVRPFGR